MTHSLFRIFQARPLCPDNISFEEAETALHCWTNTCQERDLTWERIRLAVYQHELIFKQLVELNLQMSALEHA